MADDDFHAFDYVLAMDADNLALLETRCPVPYRSRLGLFMQHARRFPGVTEVPDPYYGGAAGFELVLDYVEDACANLIEHIEAARSA